MTRPQHLHQSRAFRAARNHSLLVNILRVMLPTFTIITFGLYFISSGISVSVGPGEASIKSIALSGDSIRMERPSYTGFDESNGKYVVSADYALQNIKEPNVFNLFQIKAQSQTTADEWIEMLAKEGTFHAKEEWLELKNGIDIANNSGMKARLKTAYVNMENRKITSQDPVHVDMPNGNMRADTMEINTATQHFIFQNNVFVHLENSDDTTTADHSNTPAQQGLSSALQNSSRAPIDVTSKRLELLNKKQIAFFKGSVVATQGDMQMQSDNLEINYKSNSQEGTNTQSNEPNQSRQIAKIQAISNVVITTADGRKAVADITIFDNENKLVTLDKNVRVSQDKNIISGDKLIVDLNKRHSRFPPGPSLVKGQFHPPENSASTAKPSSSKTQNLSPPNTFSGFSYTNSNGPIFVESKSLDIYELKKTAIFRGNVNVKRNNNVLKSQFMSLHYTSSGPLGGGGENTQQNGQIEKIVAQRDVFISAPDNQTISGDTATFLLSKDKAIVKGNVVVTQGENIIKGDQLHLNLKTGEYRLHDNNETVVNTSSSSSETEPKQRVRLMFTPKKRENNKP